MVSLDLSRTHLKSSVFENSLFLQCNRKKKKEKNIGSAFLPSIFNFTIHKFIHLHEILNIIIVLYFSVVEYKIADMGFLKYYLAPKIEEQDEN